MQSTAETSDSRDSRDASDPRDPRDWIDPFCPLLSDRTGVIPGDPPRPANPAAQRTAQALACFSANASAGLPDALIDGDAASLDDALSAAARLIGGWRQPLFGGLGTDVAGARALTRLALHCGAILDHAHGESMAQALRALQDRGGFTCTLSEIRARADLMVCIGTDPSVWTPDFFERCGFGEVVPDAPPERKVVFLRGAVSDAANDRSEPRGRSDQGVRSDQGAQSDQPLRETAGVCVETVDLKEADSHVMLAELNAGCAQRLLPRASADWPALQGLAAQLRAARYAVLVYAPSQLPGAHPALLVEAIGRIVKTLNRTTRAGALAFGSADGSASVSQAATWLTGLPLRTALHRHGFEHDPHRFGTQRLLSRGAADGLLWVSSFSPELVPPVPAGAGTPASLPLVVLGHPAMAMRFVRGAGDGSGSARAQGNAKARDTPGAPGSGAVFIAVSTPGVDAPGHLFRGDGGVVLALKPFMNTRLPSVAELAGRLLGMMERGA